MGRVYKCVPSLYVKVVTALVSVFLLVITAVAAVYCVKAPGSPETAFGVGAVALIWIVYLITCVNAPLSVTLSGEAVTLRCVARSKTFRYADIDYAEKGEMPFGIRRFGSNGIWGYIGVIDGDKRYRTLFNNRKGIVELSHKGKVYLLSCADSGEAVRTINERITKTSEPL